MKSIILIIILLLPTLVFAVDEYDNGYCKDPVEIQRWEKLLSENPNSDPLAALHALWIGLCVQVELHNIKLNRAQDIFENFKRGIIESIQVEEKKPEKEAT